MKKTLSALLLTLPLVACDNQPAPTPTTTPEDFNYVRQIIKDTQSMVVAKGAEGDFLIHLDATPELLKIAENTKTARFLSIENPEQYITDGKCMVNIIPYATKKKLGFENSKCNYRMTCSSDLSGKYYAVELCEQL